MAFLISLASCGDLGGGCTGCIGALPEGGLPADQTVEGGGQIRVTPAGFAKISGLVSGVVNDLLGDGVCLPKQEGTASIGGWDIVGYAICENNDAQCAPGCDIDVHVDSVAVTAPDASRARIRAQLDVELDLPIRAWVVFPLVNCTVRGTITDIVIEAGSTFNIVPATGELDFTPVDINVPNLSSAVHFSGDGLGNSICAGVANIAKDILGSFLGDWIIDLLTPTIGNLLKGFLPKPLGIAGVVDVGSILGSIIPGAEAKLEARLVPGGFVQLTGDGGMSIGLITGFNADRDLATRSAELDSEPAFCVPPMKAPNLGAAPASLPTTARRTHSLAPAAQFLGGQFEPATDVAIGISETTLDLGGHHAVSSGALCVSIGTSVVDLLNVGTLAILVPSIGELTGPDGKDPVLLALRPQKALDLSVGEGTAESPAINVHVEKMEADFYAFVYERYVRIFTMSLTLDIALNLEFNQLPGQPATIKPLLKTIEASDVGIEILNEEFVRESKDDIKGILPTVLKLVLDLIPDLLNNPIEVPNFAGLTLTNLRLGKVSTDQDDFLAIFASLGGSAQLRTLLDKSPRAKSLLAELDKSLDDMPELVTTEASVRSVVVPKPAAIRAGVAGSSGGATPSVTIDVARRDHLGRELEWSWNLNDGIWHDFTSQAPLVIGGGSLVLQGKYEIGVRSRVKGDYRTTDPVGISLPVTIDSEAPRIWADDAKVDDGKLIVPARDVVSGTNLLYAYGRPGESEPWTSWQKGAGVELAVVDDVAVGGRIAVYVKDEVGNVAQATAPTSSFHGQSQGGSGCGSCSTGGGSSTGGIALAMLTALLLFRRRATTLAGRFVRSSAPVKLGLWFGGAVAMSLVPGCSCGGDSSGGDDMPTACELSEDCAAGCDEGSLPLCLENQCLCVIDVPYGRIGPYSDVDIAANGDAYVSAWAQSHGDLVVARHPGDGRVVNTEWEFVDGVPDGPVVIEDSSIRGGVLAPGDDVGKYTSIQVAGDDTPVVAYFDATHGSLKFAGKFGGVWQSHVVDDGTGTISESLGGEIAGLYASMTVRTDDGRPGIAYLALNSAGGGITTTEVRFAAATTATPTTASDWQIYPVDKLALPLADPENPDVVPLPDGLGLFIDVARDAQQAPQIVYYDRSHGDLKLATFDAAGGQFRTPEILDGASSDVGWYPSIAIDATGVAHVVYQDATRDDLLYIDTASRTPQVVDNGYRTVGTTDDGLPKPELHIVGSDANVVLTTAGPMVVYQDSTSHELLLAKKTAQGAWSYTTVAGNESPFVGAFGFFASAVSSGADIVISNWVIDQPSFQQWVQIHREAVSVD